MGADLYTSGNEIRFRDSYDATNLLHTLGLSWNKDVQPLINSDGELSIEAIQKFKQIIENSTQQSLNKADLIALGIHVDRKGENSISAWQQHFEVRKHLLIQFLEQALDNNKTIICSL